MYILFDLIIYVPSTIFQLNRDGSYCVEPILSYDKCVLLKDHNAVTPVRLEPPVPRYRVKPSTTEPLRPLPPCISFTLVRCLNYDQNIKPRNVLCANNKCQAILNVTDSPEPLLIVYLIMPLGSAH